jgi:exonuclease SbcC
VILRRLSLRNYRKFRSCEIEFPNGLIGVVGRNGMGKTTLLEAVAFALYGVSASRTRARGVRHDGCGPDEPCEVELEFAIDGTPLRAVRRARGAAESWQAELYEGANAAPSATGQRDVDATVQQRLGMDYVTFTRSVFSKQKEVAALSDAQPEERRAAIRRMVGIETITRARDQARVELRDKEKELQGARQAIAVLPERRAEAERVRGELRPAQGAVRKAKAAAQAAARDLKAASARLEALEGKYRADADLDKRLSSLRTSLQHEHRNAARIEKDIASLAEMKAEVAGLAPEARTFRAVQREKERLDRASGRHDERVELERQLPPQRRAVEQATRELEESAGAARAAREAAARQQAASDEQRTATAEANRLRQESAAAAEQLGRAGSQKDGLERAIADVRREGPAGKCPTCCRELGGSYEEILGHLAEELEAGRAAWSAASAEVARLERAVKAVDDRAAKAVRSVGEAAEAAKRAARQQEKLAAARKARVDAVANLRRTERRLAVLRKVDYDPERHERATRECERLEEIHRRVERLRKDIAREPGLKRELARGRKEIDSLARAQAGAERKRKALGFDPEAHRTAQAAERKARDRDKDAALASRDAEAQVTRLQDRLARVLAEIERLEKLEAGIAEGEEEARYLRRAAALLDAFRNELIGRVRPQIEEHASYLLDQVTAGRYPRVVLDDDYDISLDDGAGVFPLRRFSGGEEDLANLCLRLAIAQVVAQRGGGQAPSVVVLDEVFAAQDTERREKLLQALGRLQEIFRQIVLITHMEDIHDRVPHVLRVSENAAREAEAAWV